MEAVQGTRARRHQPDACDPQSGPRASSARSSCSIAISVALGHPWLWLLLWFLPYLTVWRVINRLRSIAEHGGMIESNDRRNTTHSVRQHAIARFCLVPYRIGWHLAHHVDSGVPMYNLPQYHRELVAGRLRHTRARVPAATSALWRKLSSGATSTRTA